MTSAQPSITGDDTEMAYHEAGHVVLAYRIGYHIRRGVTIDPAVASCWKANWPDAGCWERECNPCPGR